MVLRKRNKLIQGWGINDADYNVVTLDLNGKQVMCPIYSTWKDTVQRTKSDKFKNKYPTYKECTITERWKLFSNFKRWVDSQIWAGLELDKDVLFSGNKHYSEETCTFIPKSINTLLRLVTGDCETPLGVVFNKTPQSMKSKLKKPYMGRVNQFGVAGQRHLGMHATVDEAHKAWQWAKAEEIESAVSWYALQPCFRTDVAEALTSRVWQLRLDHSTNKETKYL